MIKNTSNKKNANSNKDESKALKIAQSKIQHKKKVLDKARHRSIELFSEKLELKKEYKDIVALNRKIEQQKIEIEAKNDRLKRSIEKGKRRTIELFGKHIDLKKASKRIDIQNQLIEVKNKELENKNRAINDSLTYAKLIQQSILPSPQFIASKFSDSFVLFRPKDIVSGDFYWYSEQRHLQYLALVDCTGHGVPGALMSMIGNSLLNKIVDKQIKIKPSEILKKLNQEVTFALQQNFDTSISQANGMDITLCQINTLINEVTIASAIQNYFIVDDEKVHFIKGNNFSIGGMFTDYPNLNFTDYKIKAGKELKIYMYSDGYVDQFGGNDGQKFMICKFKKMINENHHLPMREQKKIYNQTLDNWKGKYKQIDDISIIGFSLKPKVRNKTR